MKSAGAWEEGPRILEQNHRSTDTRSVVAPKSTESIRMPNAVAPISSPALASPAFDPRLRLGGPAGSRLGATHQMAALDMAPGSSDRPSVDQALGLFQNVLVDQMVKSMRAAVPKSGLFGEDSGQDMFQSFLDAEYSKSLGEQMGDLGLTEALKQQLGIANDQPALFLPRPWATGATEKTTHPAPVYITK